MKLDWKHLFNWDVAEVKAPEAVLDNGSIAGYKVVVTYKYHGTDEEFYSVNEPTMYKLYAGPQDAATVAYKSHLANIQCQAARQAKRLARQR